MSERKNAIKEIEFKVNYVKNKVFELIHGEVDSLTLLNGIDEIDNMLFDINDFIKDLKDE